MEGKKGGLSIRLPFQSAVFQQEAEESPGGQGGQVQCNRYPGRGLLIQILGMFIPVSAYRNINNLKLHIFLKE